MTDILTINKLTVHVFANTGSSGITFFYDGETICSRYFNGRVDPKKLILEAKRQLPLVQRILNV